jgi:hypothetical protein
MASPRPRIGVLRSQRADRGGRIPKLAWTTAMMNDMEPAVIGVLALSVLGLELRALIELRSRP